MSHHGQDGKAMTRYFKGTLLAVVSIAFAGVALAENPPATDQQQTSDESYESTTSPSSASSPHQRQRTHEQAAEASPTADTDPAAASTKHQRETTGVRTAKSKAERDRMMEDCVEQARARDSSMSQEQ